MSFNQTGNFWAQTILGQSENCTVEFYIEVWFEDGFSITSDMYSIKVKALLKGDINGDRKVDIKDIAYVARHFGETEP